MTEYKSFKAQQLFTVKANPQLDKRYFIFSKEGKYPYFTRTVFNNGIYGYVDYLDEEHLVKGGCLAVGMLGMQFFYFDRDFYSGQFTKHIRPIGFELTRELALYFKAIFDKCSVVYRGVLVRDFEKTFYETDLELPVDANGKIDFTYMAARIRELEAARIRELEAARIRELEAARIRELEAYLKVTGLSDYTLSDDDRSLLAKFRAGGGWKHHCLKLQMSLMCKIRIAS